MTPREHVDLVPLGQELADTTLTNVTAMLHSTKSFVPNDRDPAIPQTLDELTSNESTEHFSLSVQQALGLKLPVFEFDGKGEQSLFVQQYSKVREIKQLSDLVQYGIAVRWIVSILKIDGKANLTSLPMLAASAQFGYVAAKARFEVLGMSSPRIGRLIPAVTEVNVETFVTFTNALNAIKDLVWEPDTSIAPTVVAISSRILASFHNA